MLDNLVTLAVGEGNLHSQLTFRDDAGDVDLPEHLKNASRNAYCTSLKNQNG